MNPQIIIKPTTPRFFMNGQELQIITEPTIDSLLEELPKEIKYSYEYTSKKWDGSILNVCTLEEELRLQIKWSMGMWYVSYGEDINYEGWYPHIEILHKNLVIALSDLKKELEKLPTDLKDFKWIVNEKENSLV